MKSIEPTQLLRQLQNRWGFIAKEAFEGPSFWASRNDVELALLAAPGDEQISDPRKLVTNLHKVGILRQDKAGAWSIPSYILEFARAMIWKRHYLRAKPS